MVYVAYVHYYGVVYLAYAHYHCVANYNKWIESARKNGAIFSGFGVKKNEICANAIFTGAAAGIKNSELFYKNSFILEEITKDQVEE